MTQPASKRLVTEATGPALFAPLGDRAFTSVRTALDGGRSCAIWGSGDSTLDASDGTARMMELVASDMAAKYPNYRVVGRTWDGTTDKWNAASIIQAGPSGRRYAQFSGRSMRYYTATAPQVTTGILDLRVLVAPDAWSPAAAQVLVGRARKGATTLTNDLQFELRLKPGGILSCRYSADGSTWTSDRDSSTAVPGTTDGQFLWVRATIEGNTGGSYFVNYYTSPADDAFTWTKVGNTITGTTTFTGLHPAVDTSFFEIGAENWQPSAGAFSGKISEVQIRDGIDGPAIAPVLPELWQRYGDASTTFGGSPTLWILNAARSGTAITTATPYHLTGNRLLRETPNYGQSVLIFCDSHNEVDASGKTLWTDVYTNWVSQVQARIPDAAVLVVKQNPHTSAWVNETLYGESHKLRLDELARLAAKNGWSVLDVYSAFLNDSRWAGGTLINADGLHPSATIGYRLTGDVLRRAVGR